MIVVAMASSWFWTSAESAVQTLISVVLLLISYLVKRVGTCKVARRSIKCGASRPNQPCNGRLSKIQPAVLRMSVDGAQDATGYIIRECLIVCAAKQCVSAITTCALGRLHTICSLVAKADTTSTPPGSLEKAASESRLMSRV